MNWKITTFLFALVIGACGLVALLASPELRHTTASLVAHEFPRLRNLMFGNSQQELRSRLATAGFQLGQPALIRIFKEDSVLEVWMMRSGRYDLFATYPICKWSGSLGPKLQEGDFQSPEGFYEVSWKQLLPTSRYHRAFNTGFPNAYDKALGRTGSVVMVHGDCVSIGCYAMTDPYIEEIYAVVEAALNNGQPSVPVHLFPFRMTTENLARHASNKWASFWQNLAEGDALFQATRINMDVYACNGKYAFGQSHPGCEKVQSW